MIECCAVLVPYILSSDSHAIAMIHEHHIFCFGHLRMFPNTDTAVGAATALLFELTNADLSDFCAALRCVAPRLISSSGPSGHLILSPIRC